ncbi:RICIN domain-containing protein, partial [Paenibacillus larvae]
ILINMGGNRFIERRIAAKDPLNPNDRTPELTLGEALEKSIGMYLDEENKNFYFINEETGTKHIISPDLVHLVFDKKTGKKIKEEQERKPDIKTIYGMTIRPGMNIQINVPVLYDDFTKKSGMWSGGNYDTEHALYKGQCYEIPAQKEGVYSNFSLEPKAIYLIVIAVKGKEAGNVTVNITESKEIKEIGNFEIGKNYKYQKMILFNDMKEHLKLHIKSETNDSVYIDNLSIIKIGKGIDKLKQENIEYAKNVGFDDRFYISAISGEEMVITNNSPIAVMKKKDGTKQQKLELQFLNNGSFKIMDTSKSTNKVLTLQKGYSILSFREDESIKTQFWYLKKSTNPNQMGYQIISAWDRSKVLEYDIYKDEKVGDGWPIRIASLDENKPSQYFKFPQEIAPVLPDGEYQIKSRKDTNVLADLSENKSGAIVHAFKNHDLINQKWNFVYDSSKQAYKIKSSQNPNLLLTWTSKSGNLIIGYEDHRYNDQYWKIKKSTKDGYYKIRNVENLNYLLDLKDGNTSDRTPLCAGWESGKPSQEWKIEPPSDRPLKDG